MPKKYLIILLLVVLVIIILILPKQWATKKLPASQPANKTATTTEAGVKANVPSLVPVTTLAPAQVPKAMPSNLPFEKGAQILQNFEIKDPTTGKTQSTRAYISGKTIDQNFTLYQKYLKDNGWTVTSSLSQPAINNLSATKAGARLDITIAKDAKGQVTVSVSYVN
jgi:hypothetical protein